jgi:hypothetical protein
MKTPQVFPVKPGKNLSIIDGGLDRWKWSILKVMLRCLNIGVSLR